MHDGVTRSFRVHLPSGFDTCAHVPLVFNLHGRGSNGLQQEFYTQFSNVADTGNFIAVYPDAINNEWELNGAGVDDVGFIQALIDTLYSEFRIDRNKVYSCGMSMGGYMSYRLACELADHIAAIASVTGLLATFPCNPSRPIPVLQMHGTEDPTVPYAGVAQTINAWVQYNGCPQQPDTVPFPDIDHTDSSTVTKNTYAPCDAATEVVLYTIHGGEHTWPDAFISIGITSGDINASNTIWNFFKQYELSTYPVALPCDSATSAESWREQTAPHHVRYLPESKCLIAEWENNTFEITLIDALGKQIQTIHGENRITIPFAPAPGVYYYAFRSRNILTGKGRFIVY